MIGLGVLVAQTLLDSPLSAAGTREFHISGSWADPAVERVARSVADDGALPADPPSSTSPGAPRSVSPRR